MDISQIYGGRAPSGGFKHTLQPRAVRLHQVRHNLSSVPTHTHHPIPLYGELTPGRKGNCLFTAKVMTD